MSCPYSNPEHCPLYIASHLGAGGCDDGRLAEGGCAVTRGLDYQAALGRLTRPVAQTAFNRAAARLKERLQ
jgi:hypothetical protein